jgi:hypothetical protein
LLFPKHFWPHWLPPNFILPGAAPSVVEGVGSNPGVDVMIAIFCDFCPFSSKKLSLFSKTNVMIIFLKKTRSSLSKNANIFAKCFGKNIFKIITSVPAIAIGFNFPRENKIGGENFSSAPFLS